MNIKKNFFTLIELLIVLAIIGAVATLALDQSSEVVDQTRYDLTEQNGAEIQNAIIGDVENGGRFLRDMGRLPMVTIAGDFKQGDDDYGKILQELWQPADSSLKWKNLELPDMNDSNSHVYWTEYTWDKLPDSISLNVGWRGPYLNMGARTELYDGWGNPWAIDIEKYTYTDVDGVEVKDEDWRDNHYEDPDPVSAPVVGKEIRGLKSFGRDHEEDDSDENWQNQDQKFEFPENRVFCSLTFSIKVRDTNGNSVSPVNTKPNNLKAYEADDFVADNELIYKCRQKTIVNFNPSDALTWLPVGLSSSLQVHNSSKSYSKGEYVIDNGDVYQSSKNNNTSLLTSGDWTLILPSYSSSNPYSVNDLVFYDNKVYQCIQSALNYAPTDPAYWDYLTNFTFRKENIVDLRTAIFIPDVRDSKMGILGMFNEWDGANNFSVSFLSSLRDEDGVADDDLTSQLGDNWSTITINGLTPGIRKFYIYGFNGDYRRGSFVQTIDLKPGSNYREVILTEEL